MERGKLRTSSINCENIIMTGIFTKADASKTNEMAQKSYNT